MDLKVIREREREREREGDSKQEMEWLGERKSTKKKADERLREDETRRVWIIEREEEREGIR